MNTKKLQSQMDNLKPFKAEVKVTELDKDLITKFEMTLNSKQEKKTQNLY